MLPPVDPTVLERNPNFDVLYKDLCARKLNADGSTRDTKKQRMSDEIRRSLTNHRTSQLITHLLTHTLAALPSLSLTLPQNLHYPIDLVIALLKGQTPASERDILAADTHLFLSNTDIIGAALSDQFTTTASLLCKIADPNGSLEIGDLHTKAEEVRRAATLDLPTELAEEKIHLANTAYTLLTLHLQTLQSSILVLERTQHGALARAASTHAEHIAARATLLGLQARIHMHTHPPPAEFVAALKKFRVEQESNEARLRDRERLARRALELYGQAGERGMRDLAGRKGALMSEIRRMEGEIGGLERGGS